MDFTREAYRGRPLHLTSNKANPGAHHYIQATSTTCRYIPSKDKGKRGRPNMQKKLWIPMLCGTAFLCCGCCNLSLLDISCKNPFQRTQVVVPCSTQQPQTTPQPTYYVLKKYEPPRIQVIETDSSDIQFYEPLPFKTKE